MRVICIKLKGAYILITIIKIEKIKNGQKPKILYKESV